MKKIFEEAKKHPEYWVADFYLEISEQLLKICEEQNVSIEKLSKLSNVPKRKIKNILKGNDFNLKTIITLFNALHYKLDFKVKPIVN